MIETFFEIFFFIKSLILSPEKESYPPPSLPSLAKECQDQNSNHREKDSLQNFLQLLSSFFFFFLWNRFGNSKENSRSPKRDSKDMEKQILEDS